MGAVTLTHSLVEEGCKKLRFDEALEKAEVVVRLI
jgi:hypothetical protein